MSASILKDCRFSWIALLGAAKRYEPFQLELGYRLGAAIAPACKGVVTGATTGIPLNHEDEFMRHVVRTLRERFFTHPTK